MRHKYLYLMAVVMLIGALATGCISSDNESTTTTPAPESFYLNVTVVGQDAIEVGLSEIKSLEYQNITATMVKKTGATFETQWGGALLYDFMSYLGIENIQAITLVALDGYEKEIEYAQLQEAILAWKDGDGNEISEEDGGPIRFVAPGLPANTWIQNLYEIRVTI